MRYLVALSLCLSAGPAAAQTRAAQWDLSVGRGNGGWRVAGAVSRIVARPFPFLEVGGLIRGTAYGGDPAGFTRRDGDTTLPPSITLDPSLAALTLGVVLEIPFARTLRVGMNLDLLGLARGPTRDLGAFSAAPATVALFRYGTRDLGSLNSEFYFAGALSPRLELRGGLSHYALGYRVRGAGDDQARYQRFDDAYFVAVRLR